jgi:hypothetical protein
VRTKIVIATAQRHDGLPTCGVSDGWAEGEKDGACAGPDAQNGNYQFRKTEKRRTAERRQLSNSQFGLDLYRVSPTGFEPVTFGFGGPQLVTGQTQAFTVLLPLGTPLSAIPQIPYSLIISARYQGFCDKLVTASAELNPRLRRRRRGGVRVKYTLKL